MKKIITNPMVNYENQWVALSSDNKKILAASKNLEDLDKEIKKIKNLKFTVIKILPFNTVLAP